MKLKTKFVAAAIAVAMCGPAMAGIVATFDWQEVTTGTAWWTGYGYSEVDNGGTMQAGGRAASWHDGTVGKAIKASYAQDVDPGTFTMNGGQQFTVLSIDVSSNEGSFTNSVYLEGRLGGAAGAVVWTLDPADAVGMQTYTSGMSGLVDTLVWWGPGDSGGTIWNNEIDNLTVDVIPEPATLGLVGLFGGALVAMRRKFRI